MAQLSPAAYVVQVFGGVRKTADAINRTPGAVSLWFRSKERKGCAGGVPRSAQHAILEVAKVRGLDITANDLIYGREIQEESSADKEAEAKLA